MACYHPIPAWRNKGGDIIFRPEGAVGFGFKIPCGQCVGCRLERSRQWAVRCMAESRLHDYNCFLTLTYDDAHLPIDGSLHKEHFQMFVKRYRKNSGNRVRYFHCGEYGDSNGRPHYHALFFGVDFRDKKFYKDSGSGSHLFTSAALDSLWGLGKCWIGSVTFESCAYVARYVMKKVTGLHSDRHYERVNVETGEIFKLAPEYVTMSLKPGIGAEWFSKYAGDVYPSDQVIVRGKACRPPRYFDKLLERFDAEMLHDIRGRRARFSSRFASDHTPERLGVQEEVTKSRLKFLKRDL